VSQAFSLPSNVKTSLKAIASQLVRLPAMPLLALIWVYQKVVSPSIPAMFGPTISCRYYPTCSHYAAESLRTHGAVLGLFFAVRRLLRCTPFHRGGIDLVPAPGVMRRVCQRVRSTQVSA
jgi:putative membrane protein insertion efficiency factor